MVALRQVLVFWADCDVGINAGANLGYLAIFVWPPLALMNGVLFTLVFAVARTRNTGGFAAGVALFALAVVTVAEMNVLIPLLTPSGYPLTC